MIAQRRLVVSGPSGDENVVVRLFQPEQDERGWICRYEIAWPDQARSRFVAGIDSVQALLLALQKIGI